MSMESLNSRNSTNGKLSIWPRSGTQHGVTAVPKLLAVSRVSATNPAAMAYGIWGHNEFAFDEALNLSRSLNLKLEHKTGGYRTEGQMIGVNPEAGGRRRNATEDSGYAAPLVRKDSKLRLARPEERDPRRLAKPQTDWDHLHGLLMAYRQGDVPVAQTYLQHNAADRKDRVLHLLNVWIEEAETPDLRKEAEVLRFGLS